MRLSITEALTLTLAPLSIYLSGCSHFQQQIVTRERVPIIESAFDHGAEDGWTVLLGKITWLSTTNGVSTSTGTTGHISCNPRGDGKTAYYVAPDKFHCDWSTFTTLMLDLKSSGGKPYSQGFGMYGDVYLANGTLTAQRLFDHLPSECWETFNVPLTDDGKWTLGGGAKTLAEVLRNVSDFQIRAEYGFGNDRSSLDNVQLFRAK